MQGRISIGQMGRVRGIVIVALAICCLVSGFSYAQQNRKLQDLFSVSFPTEKEGWACGRWGTIVHTSDGGHTWSRQESGTDYTLVSIYFVDAEHGWAVGDAGTIIHTSDGGKSWRKQKSPVPYFLMGIHFVNPQAGWAVGERTHILFTGDGGKTWKVQFKDEDYILKAVSFCDAKNGWAAGEYGLVYHTDDGGATWTKQLGGFGVSEETGDLVAGNILFSIRAIDPKTAWAVGIDGYVTKTVDGGKTWQAVEKGIPKTHLFGVTQGGGGMVVGGTSCILTSVDGGNTFKDAKTQPPVNYGWLYGVASRGKAGFVAVGKDGWIYLADNDALSWRLAERR